MLIGKVSRRQTKQFQLWYMAEQSLRVDQNVRVFLCPYSAIGATIAISTRDPVGTTGYPGIVWVVIRLPVEVDGSQFTSLIRFNSFRIVYAECIVLLLLWTWRSFLCIARIQGCLLALGLWHTQETWITSPPTSRCIARSLSPASDASFSSKTSAVVFFCY